MLTFFHSCALVETSLINGGISSTDISLIPPQAFQATTGFGYYNGCAAARAVERVTG